MTNSHEPGRPDDWSRGGYVPGEQYYGEPYEGSRQVHPGRPGSARPGAPGAGRPGPGQNRRCHRAALAGRGTAGHPGREHQDREPRAGSHRAGSHVAARTAAIGTGAPGQAQPGRRRRGRLEGLFGALFDFSFTSFVTTRIIKVLYALILVLAVLSALISPWPCSRRARPRPGHTDHRRPAVHHHRHAFWRLVLEAFVVVFRIAEDVRPCASAATASG